MISYKGKTILVTGGAGFIGSNLVDALLKNKAKYVKVLDNLSTGKMDNLKEAERHENFKFIKGDIRDYQTCLKACEGCDVIFHEAALVSVPKSMEDPILNNDINITGTLNMIKAASESGVKRFVYASSAAVYGSNPKLPKVESMDREYISPYALSKGVDEDYASLFQNVKELGKGMTLIGLRYFNVYGPRQDPKSPYSGVISIFVNRIINEEKITIFGDGKNTRDFVFVGDVVQANLLAGKKKVDKNIPQIYNVGTGKSITLLTLIKEIENITDKKVEVSFEAARKGDIKDSRSKIKKIQEYLDYEPKYTIKEGLKKLIDSI